MVMTTRGMKMAMGDETWSHRATSHETEDLHGSMNRGASAWTTRPHTKVPSPESAQ